MPATPTSLLAFIAQYMTLFGAASLAPLIAQEAVPSVADQDKVWLRLDNLGNPQQFYRFSGTWKPLASWAITGTTAQRPSAPFEGHIYFDTTIGAALVWRSGWITLGGVTGDLKLVRAASLASALASNPGWVQDTSYATDTGATLAPTVFALRKS
jgi:hypothetical protein